MRPPRARSAASRSLVALTLIACAVGCVSVRPLEPDGVVRANEGLLVIQVWTEVPIRSISISGASLPLKLARGTHLLLVAVSAGWHHWSGLSVELSTSDSRQGETVRLSYRETPEFRFRVEAGRVNYPGMLEVYDQWWTAGLRSVDRAAMAIEEIRSRFPSLLDRYPLVYAGPVRHAFLERYFAVRSAREKKDVPKADAP